MMDRNTQKLLRMALALCAAFVLGVAGWTIGRHEATLRNGQVVLLELAPVDPRSLMQGDYMVLNYAEEAQVHRRMQEIAKQTGNGDMTAGTAGTADITHAYLQLDAQGRAKVAGLGRDAQAPQGQVALRLRGNPQRPDLGPHSFFFQEGTASKYEPARWGELRVTADGTALLVALRDADLKLLGTNVF